VGQRNKPTKSAQRGGRDGDLVACRPSMFAFTAVSTPNPDIINKAAVTTIASAAAYTNSNVNAATAAATIVASDAVQLHQPLIQGSRNLDSYLRRAKGGGQNEPNVPLTGCGRGPLIKQAQQLVVVQTGVTAPRYCQRCQWWE
jgi:hypothetical protein